jgi:hypothetical protein
MVAGGAFAVGLRVLVLQRGDLSIDMSLHLGDRAAAAKEKPPVVVRRAKLRFIGVVPVISVAASGGSHPAGTRRRGSRLVCDSRAQW